MQHRWKCTEDVGNKRRSMNPHAYQVERRKVSLDWATGNQRVRKHGTTAFVREETTE
jgi:hypothetical protein